MQAEARTYFIQAGGLAWHSQACFFRKRVEPEPLTPRQQAAARRAYNKNVASTPPLFYTPRWESPEATMADRQRAAITSAQHYRRVEARFILSIRARILALPTDLRQAVHAKWEQRRWATAPHYLADFLHQETKHLAPCEPSAVFASR